MDWATDNAIAPDQALSEQLRSGFATDDEFDAVVGVFGMINVLRGHRSEGYPEDIRLTEGWILGADRFPI